jgi:hypothetical protein
MKRTILFISMLLLCVVTYAQREITAPKPTALVVDSKGVLTDLETGDEYSGEAPVTVRFYANAPEEDGFSLTCAWEFFKEGEEEPYLVRHDASVEIELRESGTTIVMPNITYTSIEDSEVFWPFDSETYQPFKIILAESTLEAPNAFSPNGDGNRDVNKISISLTVADTATIDVVNLDGGMLDWAAAGRPMVSENGQPPQVV